MKKLPILWQRLVNERGQTCKRCDATETAVDEAALKLSCALNQLGIEVVVEKMALDLPTFMKAPLESNRIWIAGVPLEKWLSATSGHSPCCSTCGGSDCRTVMVDGKCYEVLSAELIIKAGILASKQLIHSD